MSLSKVLTRPPLRGLATKFAATPMDPVQAALLEEQCILVDSTDQVSIRLQWLSI
jgi:hypothetical protein